MLDSLMRLRPAVMLVAASLLWTVRVDAHPAPFSYLDLRLQRQTIDASLVVHIFDAAHELQVDRAERLLDPAFAQSMLPALAAMMSGRLSLGADGRALHPVWSTVEVIPDRQSLRLAARLSLDTTPGTLSIEGTLFPYDPQHQTFVNVYESGALTQAIIDGRHPQFEYFAGTRQGAFAVVKKFVPAGVHHILIGPDHILFLVGLLLLGGSVRRLALIVTGFTLAHSITLSLATLGIFNPPARLIEPAIALSVVYVGFDNLLVRQGRDMRAWIAFAFGFIHGFGFANVLNEMHLPARAIGWSLFSFNAGVEVGQLLIVAVVATALGALRARSEIGARWIVQLGSTIVIVAGAYWFVQRVVFVGGL